MGMLLTLILLAFTGPEAEPPRWLCRGDTARFCEVDAPDVARAYRAASDEFREAIPAALAIVDPGGKYPEWELELWRICWRESKCGRFGRVSSHRGDRWAGRIVYADAVDRGRLRPDKCPEHRVGDGADRTPGDFSTRGGFGTMAAGNLWHLAKRLEQDCVGPEALDEPANAALVAAGIFANCRRWDGEPGARYRRTCTCQEHAIRWMGRGKWLRLTHGERRWRVTRQCGEQPALTLRQYMGDAGTYAWRFTRQLMDSVAVLSLAVIKSAAS